MNGCMSSRTRRQYKTGSERVSKYDSISPRIGVDPTNDLRDDHPSDADSRAKIAIDFKVQGWMDVSITLHLSLLRAADGQSFGGYMFGLDKPSGRAVGSFLKRIKIK